MSYSLNIHFYRYFVSLCVLFFALSAKGQLNADFTADTVKGCAPLVVQFTDLSSGNPTSWSWDLGNGNTATQQSPGAIYFATGSYTVKLVVSDGIGTSTITKEQYIVVSEQPTVDFTADNTRGCLPLRMQFSDNSDAGSASITGWEWDFGDGDTSFSQSPLHAYSTSGDFPVTLKIINSSGCLQVLTKNNFAHALTTPKAAYSQRISSGCGLPVTVNFTNTSNGGSALSYKWDFGDGNTSTQASPVYTFNQTGTFDVHLTASNELGCIDSVSKVTVINSVKADFAGPASVCAGAANTFVNNSVPSVFSSTWSFSDNTTSTDTNVVKAFATAGNYTVKLVNNFGSCKDSVTKNITVLPKPALDFSIDAPAASCTVPVHASFTPLAPSAVSYFWSFGDSATSDAANAVHDYLKYGVFAVQLKITDANGCSDSLTKNKAVSIIAATINKFTGLPAAGCIPVTAPFSADITTPESIKSYLWDFGDGTTSASSSTQHTYAAAGSYNVSLQIATASGCLDTFFLKNAVVVSPKPIPDFSAGTTVTCASSPVKFQDLSTGSVTKWTWKFGEKGIGSGRNPSYTFQDTGYFNITLIVSNKGCTDSVTKQSLVYVNPPIAKFSVTNNCASPLTKKFNNKSIGAQTSAWDFGNGDTSTKDSPVYTYAAPGRYRVKLTTTNGSCSDTYIDLVVVIEEHPDFSTDKQENCKNLPIEFRAINADTNNIKGYTWNFGDSTPKVSTRISTISHSFLSHGSYKIALSVVDKLGCVQTIRHADSINIFGPVAGLISPKGNCENSLLTFTDTSKPSKKYAVTKWEINYGDGVNEQLTTPVFQHTYVSAGKYNISLAVTDSYGCADTIKNKNTVTITNTKAAYTVNDTITCRNTAAQFTGISDNESLTYKWSFGDGSSSSALANPSHLYAASGSYDVSLIVTDTVGCSDTATVINAILVANPSAAFTVNDSVFPCPPAQVNFAGNVTFSTSIKWDFGDSASSNVKNPLHYFNTAGNYLVKLVSQGHGNCADTATKQILVKGPKGSISYTPITRCGPATINFTASATDNDRLTWDFGDGTTISTRSFAISHTYPDVGQYLPRLLLQDTTLKCTVTVNGTDTVNVSSVKANIQNFNPVYCDSAFIQFNDSSKAMYDSVDTYLWNFGDGTTSNQRNPLHIYKQAGVYPLNLFITTIGGCKDFAGGQDVKVVKGPSTRVEASPVTCVNEPVDFKSVSLFADTTIVSWSWLFGNGNTSADETPVSQVYTTAGNFLIIAAATNSAGCSDTAQLLLKVNSLPNVFAGNDTAICLGQSAVLNVSGAKTYRWLNDPLLSCTNCSNPVVKPTENVNFIVTGTDSLSCQHTDTVQVKVLKPFKITASLPDTICIGEAAHLFAGGTDIYAWSPATGLNNANIPNPLASPTANTTYTVVGQDYKKCFTDSAKVSVIVYPLPLFNILGDIFSGPIGDSITINTTGSADIIKYSWSPAAGLSCTACAQPVATPTTTTTYTGVASNRGGCTALDQVTIEVFCNNGNIFVPNTFSPNNDGVNDLFYPRGKGIGQVRSFQIFNKFGNVVFFKTNININDERNAWDGTFNGHPAQSDVYIYKMEVVCANGQVIPVSGSISLIR